jgi:hypothetical protein
MSKARQLADLGNQVDDGAITGTNMIVNGAMNVNQRGNFTGVTSSSYFVDRFQYVGTDECTWSLSQVSDAPSGTGFTNSLKLENTVADASIIAGDYAQLRHKFENQDLKHLMKGTANAKSVTLSFWVKASIAQDYSVRIRENYSSTFRHNVQQFTLTSANTWQKVTMTFAGDTGGDDFSGSDDILPNIIIEWMLGAGSDYQGGTPNAGWVDLNNADFDATDTFLATVNSTFQITGVCLNVGDSAIDFPHESYGETLAKCQRYTYIISGAGYTPATDSAYARYFMFGTGSTTAKWLVPFPVSMKSTPSLIKNNFTSSTVQVYSYTDDAAKTLSSISLAEGGISQSQVNFTVSGAGDGHILTWRWNNSPAAYIGFEAEL